MKRAAKRTAKRAAKGPATERRRRAKAASRPRKDGASAAEEIAHALTAALERREDARASEFLALFESRYGVELGAADVRALGRFARANLGALVQLTRRRDSNVRQLAVVALGASGDPRAVEPLLAVLLAGRDFFDHDFVYEAAGRLGRRGVAAFERVARRGTPRVRRAAIACIGLSHAGAPALAALTRLVDVEGPSGHLCSALFNLRPAGGVALARRCVVEARSASLVHAFEAAEACATVASRASSQARALARLGEAIEMRLGEPRLWTTSGDPWFSAFAFALHALSDAAPARLVALLDDPRWRGVDADRRALRREWRALARSDLRLRLAPVLSKR